jgi:oligoribonuclease (3'-5' exoribonuclease)
MKDLYSKYKQAVIATLVTASLSFTGVVATGFMDWVKYPSINSKLDEKQQQEITFIKSDIKKCKKDATSTDSLLTKKIEKSHKELECKIENTNEDLATIKEHTYKIIGILEANRYKVEAHNNQDTIKESITYTNINGDSK